MCQNANPQQLKEKSTQKAERNGAWRGYE